MNFVRWSLLIAIFVAVGCGGSNPTPPPEEAPLTIEQWKLLPTQIKFEIETFERLKSGNPKLQEPREWEKFSREVLIPLKKKEMPTGK